MNINIYNPYVRQELELYHHGILGQRWGKKNGPPYPLNSSDHSASEKKAGWRKSLSDGGEKDYSKRNAALAGKYKAKADKNREKANKYGDSEKGNKYKQKAKEYDNLSKRFRDAGSEKISRYTPEQIAKGKKIAKSALLVGGSIAIGAVLYNFAAERYGARLEESLLKTAKTKIIDDELHFFTPEGAEIIPGGHGKTIDYHWNSPLHWNSPHPSYWVSNTLRRKR